MRGIKDRTNEGSDGIITTTKDTHKHPNTTSHFDARSRQRRRSSAEWLERRLRWSWYMGRHCRSREGIHYTTFLRVLRVPKFAHRRAVTPGSITTIVEYRAVNSVRLPGVDRIV